MQGKSFLIIEDHEESCRALEGLIKRRGGTAECALTMAEGLSAIRIRAQADRPFDVVLCDLSLPDSDAEKTITALKELSKTVPVRAISGAAGEGIIAKCHEAGISLILKGTSAEGIMESVFYALAEGDENYLAQASHEIIGNRKQKRELPQFISNWFTGGKLMGSLTAFVALVVAVISLGGVVNGALSRTYTNAASARNATETARVLAVKIENRFVTNEQRIRDNEDARIKIFERLEAQRQQLDRIEHLLDAGDPRVDAMWQQRLNGKTNLDLKDAGRSGLSNSPEKNR